MLRRRRLTVSASQCKTNREHETWILKQINTDRLLTLLASSISKLCAMVGCLHHILTNYKFLPNTMTLAKPSPEPAALLAWQRYFPLCSTSTSLTISVPLSTSLPLGILPLTFDHVTGSDGLTRQKRRKELPWFTDSWEGVTSTRGGTRLKEKGVVNVAYSLVVLHSLSSLSRITYHVRSWFRAAK